MKRIYPPPVNDAKQDKSTGGLSGVWQRWFATTAQHIKSDQPLITYYEGVFDDFQVDPINVMAADLNTLDTNIDGVNTDITGLNTDIAGLNTDIGTLVDEINAFGATRGLPNVTCHVTGSRTFTISASSHNDDEYTVNIQGEGVVSSEQYAVAYNVTGLSSTGLVFVVNCRDNSFLKFHAYNTTGSSISDEVTLHYTIIGYNS